VVKRIDSAYFLAGIYMRPAAATSNAGLPRVS